MSGPLDLTASNVEDIALFLNKLTDATRETGVRVNSYGTADLNLGDTSIGFCYDSETEQYVLRDRVGA